MLRLRTLYSYSPTFTFVLVSALPLLIFTACDTGLGPGGDDPEAEGQLAINFQATSTTASSSSASLLKSTHDSVVVEGTNGQLKITEVRFIVEEFELGVAEDSSEGGDGSDTEEDSLDFKAPPSFLDLPLDTTEFSPADTVDIPLRTYSDFEFAVDDLEPDEEDTEEERQQIQELLSRIREDFPNFPADASMIVEGTFTPTDGNPLDFTTFIEAEIEVEREFEGIPLEVTTDGLSRSLTVKMAPGEWFRQSDGRVRNLAQYQSTTDLLEIEKEFENGVTEIEIADD